MDYRYYMQLKCQKCGAKSRILAYPHPMYRKGTVLAVDAGFGEQASCLRCGVARLEIQNNPPGAQDEST